MMVNDYAAMLFTAAILTACLCTGCRGKQDAPPRLPDDPGPVTVDPTAGRNAVPPNVLFSGPGLYPSPIGNLSLEIQRQDPGYVTYRLIYSLDDPSSSVQAGSGPSYPFSEKELLMCWDEEGRLWTYHPVEFIHRHTAGDATLTSTFVGSGRKVREQMPQSFKDHLPGDLEAIYRKAVAASPGGVLKIPLEHASSSEHED